MRLSTVRNGLGGKLEALVERCTHSQGTQQPSNIEEVLKLLDEASEELTEVEQQEAFNPLHAFSGSELPGGYQVVRDGHSYVLKVAHEFEQNERMEEEAQALEKLKHPNIVTLEAKLELGGRFLWNRVGPSIMVASSDSHLRYAEQLGRVADDLASREPLLSPKPALEESRDVPPPFRSAASATGSDADRGHAGHRRGQGGQLGQSSEHRRPTWQQRLEKLESTRE